MDHLPHVEDREWLLDQLRDLVVKLGHAPLVSGPIVEPTDSFFPDPWEADDASVRRVAVRLLRMAGLTDLKVSLELTEGVWVDSLGRHSVAWFAGIEEGVVKLGASSARLDEPEEIVSDLAHEVAHAFRAVHALAVPDDEELEEQLTDLTAIWLGFGIFIANAAYRHRSSGGYGWYQVERAQEGYLSLQEICFALAATWSARGLDRKARKRLLSHLGANQAACVRRACAALADTDLLARLRLPPRERWPAAELGDCQEHVEPTADLAVSSAASSEEAEQGAVTTPPAPRFSVFRVRRNTTRTIATVGFTLGCLPMFLIRTRGFSLFGSQAQMAIIIFPFVGLLLGVVLARFQRGYFCSNTDCGASLDASTSRCPGCGGIVSGEIEHPDQRLDAEEALRARMNRR